MNFCKINNKKGMTRSIATFTASLEIFLSYPIPSCTIINLCLSLKFFYTTATTIFNWLQDCLSNRYQQVVYDGVTLQPLPIHRVQFFTVYKQSTILSIS